MKKLIYILLVLPLLSYGQIKLEQNKLWKGYAVSSTSGGEIRQKAQQFIYTVDNKLIRLDFSELLNMKNGEVEIKVTIDTLTWVRSKRGFNHLIGNEKNAPILNFSAPGEFKIIDGEFIFPFKLLNEAEKMDRLKVVDKFEGATFYEQTSDVKESSDKLLRSPLAGGKMKYSKLNSSSSWKSDYKLVAFAGFTFFKGISSAPLLVTKIEETKMSLIKLDYRFEPSNVQWINYVDIEEAEVSTFTLPVKNYEIDNKEKVSDCLKKRTKAELNQQIATTNNVIDKKQATTQIQHAFDGSWLFLSDDVNITGFVKLTMKELLLMDSSLCPAIIIPKGHYANRKVRGAQWTSYIHEEREKTDSSVIFKKAFPWSNTYLIMNELKNEDKSYFVEYYLDTRIIKGTGTYMNSKEVGIWEFYDPKGQLIRTENYDLKKK